MQIKTQHLVLILLALSALLLTQFISIVSNDFSEPNLRIHAVFNAYLFLVIIGSLLLIPLLWLRNRVAFKACIFLAINYMVIYMLYLSHWLPHYFMSVSTASFWGKVLGLFLTVPLLMLSIDCINTQQYREERVNKMEIVLWQLLILLGFAVFMIIR